MLKLPKSGDIWVEGIGNASAKHNEQSAQEDYLRRWYVLVGGQTIFPRRQRRGQGAEREVGKKQNGGRGDLVG